jgi:hypothetical protein
MITTSIFIRTMKDKDNHIRALSLTPPAGVCLMQHGGGRSSSWGKAQVDQLYC